MKKISFIIILFVCILTINSLLHSIIGLWQKQSLVEKTQEELTRVKQENELLKKELKRVSAPEFLEEEARNKLFLVKPGEKVVLLPSEKNEATTSARVVQERQKPIYQQWFELFF